MNNYQHILFTKILPSLVESADKNVLEHREENFALSGILIHCINRSMTWQTNRDCEYDNVSVYNEIVCTGRTSIAR